MSIDKIVCVGKNYLDHALELGDAVPEKPVIFIKPASVLKQVAAFGDKACLDFPSEETVVQPECEIVLRLARDGFQMTKADAAQAISDVTLGLDMTLRTRQTQLKQHGHPWTTAKVFKDAAVIGPWIPYATFRHYLDETYELLIDGEVCQSAKGAAMCMPPDALLVYISHFFPLKAGDIIYTGTPAGVTSIRRGSTALLRWDTFSFSVTWE